MGLRVGKRGKARFGTGLVKPRTKGSKDALMPFVFQAAAAAAKLCCWLFCWHRGFLAALCWLNRWLEPQSVATSVLLCDQVCAKAGGAASCAAGRAAWRSSAGRMRAAAGTLPPLQRSSPLGSPLLEVTCQGG